MLDELLSDARERMVKSVQATRDQFGSVRTGRATPAILDRVSVNYYGASTPLKQLATITAPEARLLTVQPFDKSSIKLIEKAITEADLGLTPGNDGNFIRLSVPELTEERNVRREIMHDLRELKGEGEVGSDDEHRAEAELQKLTDAHVADLDELLKHKEDDILEV
jgi:ribosome recycling factor